MARIVQALTQPNEEYVQKLNTTYQQDLKDEAEAEAYFFG